MWGIIYLITQGDMKNHKIFYVQQTQRLHSKRFDVQSESLEGLHEQIKSQDELLTAVLGLVGELVLKVDAIENQSSLILEWLDEDKERIDTLDNTVSESRSA